MKVTIQIQQRCLMIKFALTQVRSKQKGIPSEWHTDQSRSSDAFRIEIPFYTLPSRSCWQHPVIVV